MKYIVATLSMLLATSAFAECAKPEDMLFTCTFDGGAKTVELCMIDAEPLPKVSYRFGKTGEKPELELTQDFDPEGIELPSGNPKEGYDAGAWEEETYVDLTNGDYLYHVSQTHWTEDDIPNLVEVFKDGESIMRFDCDPKSHKGDINPLFERLKANGFVPIFIGGGWEVIKP